MSPSPWTPHGRSRALFGVFGTAALLLAAIGLSGVLACAVAKRRGEVRILVTCGATRQELIRQLLRGGLGLTMVGSLV